MGQNIWDEEEEFRDNVVELGDDGQWQDSQAVPQEILQHSKAEVKSHTQQAPQPQRKRITPDFSQVDSFVEEVQEESEEDDFQEILNDANLRIEQGRLYQMIMNHDIFEGMDANPKAVQNVQKEIRKFAKERMEVMLGMRQEKVPHQQQVVHVENQFNSLEVDLLKQLAYKMSQGKTAEVEEEEELEHVPAAPKRTGLNKIGSQSKPKVRVSAPLKKTASQIIKRTKESPMTQDIAEITAHEINREAGGSYTNAETIKQAIEKDRDYVPLSKPLEALSPKEQAERIRQTQERLSKNRRATNPNAVPMPSYEQQAAMAESMAGAAARSGLVGGILANLNKRAPKQ